MSRPLRLVPQAAQPIEFRCPLCATAHAAYIFGTNQFRIFRCGGCGLTFSKMPPRGSDASTLVQTAPGTSSRDERDHASLLASLDAARIDGPVLVVAESQDGLIHLLEQRGIVIGRVVRREDFGAADWNQPFHAAIVSDALMRVPDPRAAHGEDSQASGAASSTPYQPAHARCQAGQPYGPQLA